MHFNALRSLTQPLFNQFASQTFLAVVSEASCCSFIYDVYQEGCDHFNKPGNVPQLQRQDWRLVRLLTIIPEAYICISASFVLLAYAAMLVHQHAALRWI